MNDQISVFYASAYGNTTSLSEAISRGIQKTGLGAVSVNLELATQEEIIEVDRHSTNAFFHVLFFKREGRRLSDCLVGGVLTRPSKDVADSWSEAPLLEAICPLPCRRL